jgi:hypothetical protein
MMRRVWAAICTAFAVVAVFAVLAVTHRQPATAASGAGSVVLVRSDDGGLVPVTVPSGGVHATTQTSPTTGGSLVQSTSGQMVTATTQSHPTTRSS